MAGPKGQRESWAQYSIPAATWSGRFQLFWLIVVGHIRLVQLVMVELEWPRLVAVGKEDARRSAR